MSDNIENTIYTKNHVWIRSFDELVYIIGISDYAQQQLGDIVFVELPEVGTNTVLDSPCAVVESVKTASDVICPVAGEVVAVNTELHDQPELINESPYEHGWIMRIKCNTNSKIREGMNEEQYDNFLATN